MQQWHVLYTQPKKELIVNNQLEQRNLEVYFPVLQYDRGYRRGIRLEPFFPNYLFVRVDLLLDEATGLRWMPGVRGIVVTGDEPAVVPEAVIETLHNRLDALEKRVLRKSDSLFAPGQKVRIVDGPFKGFEAVFQAGLNGHDRVQVLLEFLGRSIRTTVQVEQLEQPSHPRM